MLLLEGYISNFTRARYYFLCAEFSDFYVNQSLTGQTIPSLLRDLFLVFKFHTYAEKRFNLDRL
jgi:hypothetical protein